MMASCKQDAPAHNNTKTILYHQRVSVRVLAPLVCFHKYICLIAASLCFFMVPVWGLEKGKKQWPSIWMEEQNNHSCGVAVRLMLHQCRVTTKCLKVSVCILSQTPRQHDSNLQDKQRNVTWGTKTLHQSLFSLRANCLNWFLLWFSFMVFSRDG